jgi:hypothetical protein
VKRRLFLFSGALAWSAGLRPAWAGSYLDRATLLVLSSTQDLAFLRRKYGDVELARLLQRVAAARLLAAGEMSVPPEVVQAHPHLLLLLENCERAASAAVEKRVEHFQKYLRLAREEEELFRAILRHSGWQIPRQKEATSD